MIVTWLLPILLQVSPQVRDIAADFVLDHSKPYVYLAFDHIGPRKPILEGEDPSGLWLRVVNNCRVPISIGTYGFVNSSEIGVFYSVVPIDPPMIVANTNVSNDEADKNNSEAMPSGYPGAELSSATIISPGKSLIFSVPRRSVSPRWFLRIKFELRVNRGPASPGPFTELDFFNEEIPAKPQPIP